MTPRGSAANKLDRTTFDRRVFKTDSSDEGPDKSAPAILAAGMVGDRASVVFGSPGEISRFIAQRC